MKTQTLSSPNGGAIVLNADAYKKLEAEGRKFSADSGLLAPIQIWYADPAEYPHAYIVITEETPGNILVRDGNDQSGQTLMFSREQFAAAFGDTTEDALGKPQGDKDHPAEVKNPDDLHKVPDTDRSR